jgi:hypothetical protein
MVPILIAVGSTVRIKCVNPRSHLSGHVGVVTRTHHFEAEVSPSAARAAFKVDAWATPKPDIPAEDWAEVELDIPLLPTQPRFKARLHVFLPVAEMTIYALELAR